MDISFIFLEKHEPGQSASRKRKNITKILTEMNQSQVNVVRQYRTNNITMDNSTITQIVRVYDQEMPQSHTTDQPTTPWEIGKLGIQNTTKVKQPTLSLRVEW